MGKESANLGNVCLVFLRIPQSIGSRSKKMSFLFCRRAESVDEERKGHVGFNVGSDLHDVSCPIVTTLCSLFQIQLHKVVEGQSQSNFSAVELNQIFGSCCDVRL